MITSKIIKQIRNVSGHSQNSLSVLMKNKPSAQSIGKWERGERGITLESFLSICKAANVKPSEIFKELEL